MSELAFVLLGTKCDLAFDEQNIALIKKWIATNE